jgi:hypothetical protein
MGSEEVRVRGRTRREFLAGAAATTALLATAGVASADAPTLDAQWLANHEPTALVGADGQPSAWIPAWSHMRLEQSLGRGWLQVWVPRLGVVGRVQESAIGPVPQPSSAQLAEERFAGGPLNVGSVSLPARVARGGNLRLWPNGRQETLLRSLAHNAPLRVLNSVEGDDGEEWYEVNLLDAASQEPVAVGYMHNSVVRLPRVRNLASIQSPDRADNSGRWFEADLRDPAILTAYENGVAVWSTLTLKGTAKDRTPLGHHRILWRVANETMTSERIYPPIPRNAPGGYYLKNVLYTQYFNGDGASIHYNYWSSNWGYAGSHGCLGVPLHEAKFAWDWAEVGTPVNVFA